MRRAKSWFGPVVVIAFVVAAAGSVAAQKSAPSVVGVWIGSTQVPEQGTDQVTLTITKTKTGLAGTVADSLGVIDGITEVKDLAVTDGVLTCSFPLADGAIVALRLKLDGDTLKGNWTHQEGGVGDITLERKKQ